MTLRDRYNEGTEAGMVTGVKKERVTHTGLLKDHIWFFYLVSASVHQVIIRGITANKTQGQMMVGAPCSRKHGWKLIGIWSKVIIWIRQKAAIDGSPCCRHVASSAHEEPLHGLPASCHHWWGNSGKIGTLKLLVTGSEWLIFGVKIKIALKDPTRKDMPVLCELQRMIMCQLLLFIPVLIFI